MAATRTTCLQLSKEFTGVSIEQFAPFLAQAALLVGAPVFGTLADTAQAYMAMHLLKVAGFGNAVYDAEGKLTSGNESVEGDNYGTIYGKQFALLQRLVSVGMGGCMYTDAD